jgi:hypothetical protein
VRFVTIMLLLSTTPAHAQNVFLTYSQWEQMPISLREMYVAGAFDTLSTVTAVEQVSIVQHYNECVAKARLNLHQLAEIVVSIACWSRYRSTPQAPSVWMVPSRSISDRPSRSAWPREADGPPNLVSELQLASAAVASPMRKPSPNRSCSPGN